MKVPTVAFIGAGMMGQLAHLANYARLRDAGECEIAGVVDVKQKLAAAVAQKYGVPRVYRDVDELLSDSTVDGVVCIQQWPNNYRLVKRSLEAGKSVITEKPMVGRLDEAQELAELARSRGRIYTVGFMKRYDTGVEIAHRLIRSALETGAMGELRTVDALCDGGDWIQNAGGPLSVDDPTPAPLDAPTYPDGCASPAQRAVYGYLVNIFSHNINLCHHLLGEEMQPRFAQFQADAAMTAALRCGRTLITIRGGGSASPEWREWTTLVFSGGQIAIKTPTPLNRQLSAEVHVLRSAGGAMESVRHYAPVDWAFFRQARGFVRALSGEEPVRTPADQAIWDVRVMERLVQIVEIV